MAYDSVELNPGVGGSKVAADLITEGGVLKEFQRVKLVRGTQGEILEDGPGHSTARTQITGVADAEILAANTARKRAVFFNDDPAIDFYLGEGTTAVTATNFTARLRPGDAYIAEDYVGAYRGFYAAAITGRLHVTEVT